ncbi:MAG: hypothetical protein KGM96_11200, partial [Acidobacteriota bacterium]|nr:hypothetical protein [Acidobacteriota bacterium]
GRSIDPADPEVLHEEHVVYRAETTPDWRMQASGSDKILVGPRVTDSRKDSGSLLDKELTAYLNRQRKAIEADHETIGKLALAVDALARQQKELIQKAVGTRSRSRTPANSSSSRTTVAPPATDSEDDSWSFVLSSFGAEDAESGGGAGCKHFGKDG